MILKAENVDVNKTYIILEKTVTTCQYAVVINNQRYGMSYSLKEALRMAQRDPEESSYTEELNSDPNLKDIVIASWDKIDLHNLESSHPELFI